MNKPDIIHMIRAPFLSSILSPLIAGTLVAVNINNSVSIVGFLLVLIMGIGLHIATNVYNDIYDTLQGTDKINVNRNEFSGGSGILLAHPELYSTMYWIARLSLIFALLATSGLMFVIDNRLSLLLWGLYLLSAFFSKFYTAAPVKVAYRGLGEVAVWFAFGPMAILVAAVSQNLGFHPAVIAAMPITGISTLSILLLGQMIDLDADKTAGKLGVAARFGNKVTGHLYLVVQLVLVTNILLIAVIFVKNGWFILLSLIPYAIFLPRIWQAIQSNYNDIKSLQLAAKLNVRLHLLFSLLLSTGLGISLIF